MTKSVKCLKCGQETIIKGKEEFGGGWICWKKEGKSNGCGNKFMAGDPAIVNQTVGRVENENLADQKNTVLKMAKKRSKIDAVLGVSRSSGLFTQDVEDWAKTETHEEQLEQSRAVPAPERTVPPKPAPAKAAAPKPAPVKPTPPPKATIPVEAPTKPPVPKETPKAPAPVKAAAPKTRKERGREIANKTGCSTTNLTTFIGKTLGVNSAEEFKTIPIPRFEAVIWSLEQTLEKFPRGAGQIKALICDEAGVDASVKSYFHMAFAKAESN